MISRQHSETEIRELEGTTCRELLVVQYPDKPTSAEACYLNLSGTWHYAVIHYGVLFWEEEDPCPDNDLLDGEVYVDLGARHRLSGEPIRHIRMLNGCLCVGIGACELVLEYVAADDRVLVRVG